MGEEKGKGRGMEQSIEHDGTDEQNASEFRDAMDLRN